MTTPLSLQRRAAAWIGWILLLASLMILLHRIDDGAVPRRALFHPEAIYPAALYADLAHWSTWTTPFAPYFFPDLPLYFLTMATTGSPVAAAYGYGAMQFLLLVGGFYVLCGVLLRADAPHRRLAMRFCVLIGAWMCLAFSWNVHGGGRLLQLFAAAFHTGSFVLTLPALAVLIALLDPSPGASRWRQGLGFAALFSLCGLGVLSDKLFGIVFVAPAILTLLLQPRRAGSRRQLAGLVAVLAAGATAGVLAVAGINALGTLRIPSRFEVDPAGFIEAWSRLLDSHELPFDLLLRQFFDRFGLAFKTYWFLWMLATSALVLAARGAWRRRLGDFQALAPSSRQNLRFFAIHTWIGFLLTILATHYIALGQYGQHLAYPSVVFIQRYLIAVYAMPILTVALYLPVFLGDRRASRLELPQLVLLAILGVATVGRLDFSEPFPAYWPPEVACLDEAAERYDLNVGLAHFYLHSRTLNLFSRRGLHADQLDIDVEPTTWIDDRRRVGEASGYDFVILNGLRPKAEVFAKLGPGDREIDCEGWKVVIYDDPFFVSAASEQPSGKRSTRSPVR